MLQEGQERGRATGSAEEKGEVVPHRCSGTWSVLPEDFAQASPLRKPVLGGKDTEVESQLLTG